MPAFRIVFISLLSIFTINAYAEESAGSKMAMTTTAFLDEGIMPVLYTCDGKDLSPQLDWTDAPAKTESFALILSDPKAPDSPFYHWVLYNIPKKSATLTEGMKTPPSGAQLGLNSWKKKQYNGPCPPKGTTHTYIFNLYALDTKLDLPAGADAPTVLSAMKNHIVGEAKLTGVYSRWLN